MCCVWLKIAQGGKKEKVPCHQNCGTINVLNGPSCAERERGGASCSERNVLIKWGCGGVRAFFIQIIILMTGLLVEDLYFTFLC